MELLSTDKEVVPARNAIGAHAQYFVVNELLLLLVLTHSFTKCCSKCLMFSVCPVVEQPVAPTSSSRVVPRAAPDTPTPLRESSHGLWSVAAVAGIHLASSGKVVGHGGMYTEIFM